MSDSRGAPGARPSPAAAAKPALARCVGHEAVRHVSTANEFKIDALFDYSMRFTALFLIFICA
jgi:hypothetical protein